MPRGSSTGAVAAELSGEAAPGHQTRSTFFGGGAAMMAKPEDPSAHSRNADARRCWLDENAREMSEGPVFVSVIRLGARSPPGFIDLRLDFCGDPTDRLDRPVIGFPVHVPRLQLEHRLI